MTKDKIFSIVELARPQNVTRWILSFFIGYVFMGHDTVGSNFFIGIIVVVVVHIFITVQNDKEDLAIDLVNTPHRPLPSKRLTNHEANYVLIACLITVAVCAVINFPIHFWFIVIMLGISWLYNKKPTQWSRRPILSILSLSFLYSVMPLSYGYFLHHHNLHNMHFLFLIMGWWILRFSVSMLKDLRDTKGDGLHYKNTFAIIYGNKRTIQASMILVVMSYVVIFCVLFLTHFSWWWLIPLALGLRGIQLRHTLLQQNSPETLDKIFHIILNAQNQFDLIIILCLILLK